MQHDDAFVYGARFRPGSSAGHYESWFQRANHPERPLAFWIRYTVFAPAGAPESAIGELWAIVFDGERGRVVAAKSERPIDRCSFSVDDLDVSIDGARLRRGALEGAAESGGQRIAWDLRFADGGAPLLFLPRRFYDGGFPKAKALVGEPGCTFAGRIEVDGEVLEIDGWRGSQNHNWGLKHTDEYAWGQVAGFDDAPDAFLECSTARVKLGPLWTPWLTLAVLRLDGEEHRLNGLWRAVRADGRYGEEGARFDWRFDTRAEGVRLRGHLQASATRFVALRYFNPPGGEKICLNSKLAACTLVVERPGRPARTLHSASGGAFEILGDTPRLGLRVVA